MLITVLVILLIICALLFIVGGRGWTGGSATLRLTGAAAQACLALESGAAYAPLVWRNRLILFVGLVVLTLLSPYPWHP